MRLRHSSRLALCDVVRPVFYTLRIFGLAPYTFADQNRSLQLKLSWINCVYTLVCMMITSYVVQHLIRQFANIREDQVVLSLTELSKMILNYFVLVVELILSIVNRQRLIEVWNSIQIFDESFLLFLEANPIQPNVNKYCPHTSMIIELKSWLRKFLAFGIIGWAAVNILGLQAFDEPYLHNVSYMLPYIVTFVAAFKFCGLAFLLNQRFKCLNGFTTNCLTPDAKITGDMKTMEEIKTMFRRLVTASETLSETYSWSLLLFLSNLFGHLLSNMYYIIIQSTWDIIYNNKMMVSWTVCCEVSWMIMFLSQLLSIHIVCDSAVDEVNQMSNVLFEWQRLSYLTKRVDDIHLLEFYMNREVHYTAADFFNVNLQSMTSATGVLVTYLVILLQIPVSKDSS